MHCELVDLSGTPLWKLIRARNGWKKAGNTDWAAAAQAEIDHRIAKATGSVPTPRPAPTGDFQLRRLVAKARHRNHSLLIMRHLGLSQLAHSARRQRDEAMREARTRRGWLIERGIS